MENHIKLIQNFASNSYIRHFQVAQYNFYLVNEEEKLSKKRFRMRTRTAKLHEP